MIEQAKRLDYGAILFFGRPEYYPQFGFKEAVFYCHNTITLPQLMNHPMLIRTTDLASFDSIRIIECGSRYLAVFYEISDSEGFNYPAFMAMELKEGYLKDICK